MIPKNIRIECDRAVDLLIARGIETTDGDSEFLQSHVTSCPSCSERSNTINNAVHEMRSAVTYANPAMVRATQMRVRARAAELRQQQETMRPLWISSALALGWAVLSMPVLWQGFSWLGHTTRMPDLMWQTGFGIMALAPITVVGTIGLASRFHNKATS
jgi:hypothetical protein